MKVTIVAATLALVVAAPLVASAAESAQPDRWYHRVDDGATRPATNNGASAFACQGTMHYLSCVPAVSQSASPRFVGPYQLRNGMLPNGLEPNPFTYG
jgi:hypothetical protein